MPAPNSLGQQQGIVFLAQSQPSGAASVSFSGLDFSAYSLLEIIWFLQTSSASDQLLNLQVNSDSTSGHYGYWTTDRQAGNSDNGSTTAAAIGWTSAGSQVRSQGQCRFPAQSGGSTRAGSSTWGGGSGAGGVRMGYGTFIFSFNISGNVSSVSLASASGNLTGIVNLNGIP